MDRDEFEACVQSALSELPDELWARVDNVSVRVEDEHPDDPGLFGLYHGTPLTQRGSGWAGNLPDSITIYRRPLVAEFGHDPALLVDEIRITVLHELGHYFGLSEERLRALGWA